MKELEIFLQGEGIPQITLVRVPGEGTVRDILKAALAHGLPVEKNDIPVILIEDEDEELALDKRLDQVGIGHRSRVHVHRCRKVEVKVNFNGRQEMHKFGPGATVRRVKRWAVKAFGVPEVDATEHVLQICGTTKRPDEDVHIGTLVSHSDCSLCFDLVPEQRIEG
jgi:hypothetical protein